MSNRKKIPVLETLYPKTYNMVFEVTQSLTITTNGFQTSIKTKFEVEFLVLEKSGERRIYGIRKAKVATIPISDNNYLQIAEELEWQTYPIEIETDLDGNFIKMLNHKKWLKNLEQVTQSLIEEFDNSLIAICQKKERTGFSINT